MRLGHALITGLLALTFISSLGRPCAADDGPAARRPSLSESLVGDAKVDYDTAKVLFEDGDFAGAATKFRKAHDRAKDPRLLWNIAVCEKGLRHYARVDKLVEQYLDEGRAILSPEQTRAARDLRVAITSFIGTLKLAVEPGTQIAIDGEPVGTAPFERPIPLDLGAHKLTAEKAGFRPFAAPFEIAGGDETKLEIALRPLSSKARLVVQAGEGNAIAFDGRMVAATRWQAEVDPGPHTLRVTAPRRKPYELRLDLVDGSNRTVEVTLQNEAPLLWPWIAGGAALLGGAVLGGYFLFKPGTKPGDQPEGSLPPGSLQLSRWAP